MSDQTSGHQSLAKLTRVMNRPQCQVRKVESQTDTAKLAAPWPLILVRQPSTVPLLSPEFSVHLSVLVPTALAETSRAFRNPRLPHWPRLSARAFQRGRISVTLGVLYFWGFNAHLHTDRTQNPFQKNSCCQQYSTEHSSAASALQVKKLTRLSNKTSSSFLA